METNKEIANLLFPDVSKTIDDLEKEYPKRDLPQNAIVTRFAPSPTGFAHMGFMLTALIAERAAHQSNGVFILRIEDTDKNREVEGGINLLANALRSFSIPYDEGVWSEKEQIGKYGPYIQSQRKELYTVCAKYLIEKGFAYPCFCTKGELDEMRKEQEAEKVKPGYYGKWAKHRNISLDEVKNHLNKNHPFVIRIKAEGGGKERIVFKDIIRRDISMPENDLDYILLKSDGLPTYHFAHPIDDHFMRVTHIIRGEEWLPSTPLHIQIFKYFGWQMPNIGHVSVLMKMDGNSKRKISKRKDPDFNVVYYNEQGYPIDAVKEYLLNIANSNFEDWRRNNHDKLYLDYPVSLNKISPSGALFDLVKLADIGKQVIGRMSAQEIYDNTIIWANEFDPDLAKLIEENKEYTINILSIEKDQKGKRKDISKWSQVRENIGYFYDLEFGRLTSQGFDIPENINKDDFISVLEKYEIDSMDKDRNEWFDGIKKIATELEYTTDSKAYKENPNSFKGYVGDIAMFLRITLTNRTNTPDLYEIMQVLGKERIKNRINKAKEYLKSLKKE